MKVLAILMTLLGLWMIRKGLKTKELRMRIQRLKDGTLWIAAANDEEVKQVIISAGTWHCVYKPDVPEPVMKWIPVSDAMPEESDGTVLVCMPNKFPYNEKEPFVNAKHNRQVETATYSQYSDTWHYTNGGVKSTRPIAWMPRPEPWKGEER